MHVVFPVLPHGTWHADVYGLNKCLVSLFIVRMELEDGAFGMEAKRCPPCKPSVSTSDALDRGNGMFIELVVVVLGRHGRLPLMVHGMVHECSMLNARL